MAYRPNRASTNMSTNSNLLLPQPPPPPPTTPTHDAHPSSPHHCHCPPLTTTWRCRYTIQMTQERHISSQQVNTSMDVWQWQHHVQPQVSTYSPSLQSPSWPWNRCHVIYMATRWQMTTSFVVIFSDNKRPTTAHQPTPATTTTTWQLPTYENDCPHSKTTARIWKQCAHRQQWPPRYENETKRWTAFIVRHWF